MWNYLIAGLAGFLIGTEMEKNKEKSKPKKESKPKAESKPTSWKDEVNSDIEKEGFIRSNF